MVGTKIRVTQENASAEKKKKESVWRENSGYRNESSVECRRFQLEIGLPFACEPVAADEEPRIDGEGRLMFSKLFFFFFFFSSLLSSCRERQGRDYRQIPYRRQQTRLFPACRVVQRSAPRPSVRPSPPLPFFVRLVGVGVGLCCSRRCSPPCCTPSTSKPYWASCRRSEIPIPSRSETTGECEAESSSEERLGRRNSFSAGQCFGLVVFVFGEGGGGAIKRVSVWLGSVQASGLWVSGCSGAFGDVVRVREARGSMEGWAAGRRGTRTPFSFCWAHT